MKANYTKSLITVTGSGFFKTLIPTDIFNVAYCLSKFIREKNYTPYLHSLFLDVLTHQKSIRAVCQKFNSICKVLELD